MNDEPKVLHGPWTPNGCNYPLRIVEGEGILSAVVEEGSDGVWGRCGQGHWAVPAELARLAAENAELRLEADRAWDRAIRERDRAATTINAMGATVADSGDWLAERDRLRVLIGRQRTLLERAEDGMSVGRPHRPRLADEIAAVLADPDGQAAAEHLEAEKAKARAAGRRQGLAEAAELLAVTASCRRDPAVSILLEALAEEMMALAEEGDK